MSLLTAINVSSEYKVVGKDPYYYNTDYAVLQALFDAYPSEIETYLQSMVTEIDAMLGLEGSATYDAPSISSGSQTTTTVTVTGAALGDFAIASFGVSTAGLIVSATVTATDTVTIVIANLTGSPVDLGSTTVRARVLKKMPA